MVAIMDNESNSGEPVVSNRVDGSFCILVQGRDPLASEYATESMRIGSTAGDLDSGEGHEPPLHQRICDQGPESHEWEDLFLSRLI